MPDPNATDVEMPDKGRPPRYPWADWFRRKVFFIERGIDYFTPQSSMAQLLRDKASALGKGISLDDRGDGFMVTVSPHPGRRGRPRASGKGGSQ